MEQKETFKLTYSAKQQEEIQMIRKKYIPPQEDKMEQLRKMDASVTKKATTLSLTLGMIGALILGLGMSLIMTDLSQFFGISQNLEMVLGIPVGIVGIVLICLAYPVYNHIVKRERKKIAPEMIRLTDDLMKGN